MYKTFFYLDVRKGEKIFTENDENLYRWDVVYKILCLRAHIRIDSSHDCLAHTLAHLPNTRKSTSDLISPILARYDFLKYEYFWMTVVPSYGREGDGFRMTVEPSNRRERVNLALTSTRRINQTYKHKKSTNTPSSIQPLVTANYLITHSPTQEYHTSTTQYPHFNFRHGQCYITSPALIIFTFGLLDVFGLPVLLFISNITVT